MQLSSFRWRANTSQTTLTGVRARYAALFLCSRSLPCNSMFCFLMKHPAAELHKLVSSLK